MKALLVDDIDSLEGQTAGAVELRLWFDGEDGKWGGLAFRCPCGCGTDGWLPCRLPGTERQRTPEWEFDDETITVHPSVFNQGLPCQWHGWLQNGEWKLA